MQLTRKILPWHERISVGRGLVETEGQKSTLDAAYESNRLNVSKRHSLVQSSHSLLDDESDITREYESSILYFNQLFSLEISHETLLLQFLPSTSESLQDMP